MNNLKRGDISKLGREDRTISKLARIAVHDTVWGGARALYLAKRLDRMGSDVGAEAIVSDVYAQSSGREHAEYGCFECPECGQSHRGVDNALTCCAGEAFEPEPENEEEVCHD